MMIIRQVTKRIVSAALLGFLAAATVGAQAAESMDSAWTDPVMAPVRVLMDGLNSRVIEPVEKVMAPDATIVDEIPPFIWSGAGAHTKLMADFSAMMKTQGIDSFVVSVTSIDQISKTDTSAYVALSAKVVSRMGDAESQEEGRFVLALVHVGNDWKIASWSWVLNAKTPVAGVQQ